MAKYRQSVSFARTMKTFGGGFCEVGFVPSSRTKPAAQSFATAVKVAGAGVMGTVAYGAISWSISASA